MKPLYIIAMLALAGCAQQGYKAAEYQFYDECKAQYAQSQSPTYKLEAQCLNEKTDRYYSMQTESPAAKKILADGNKKRLEMAAVADKQNIGRAEYEQYLDAIFQSQVTDANKYRDASICSSYGYKKGSRDMAICMQGQANNREQQAAQQEAMNRYYQNLEADRQAQRSRDMLYIGTELLKQPEYVPPRSMSTSCSQVGGFVNCNTTY